MEIHSSRDVFAYNACKMAVCKLPVSAGDNETFLTVSVVCLQQCTGHDS